MGLHGLYVVNGGEAVEDLGEGFRGSEPPPPPSTLEITMQID